MVVLVRVGFVEHLPDLRQLKGHRNPQFRLLSGRDCLDRNYLWVGVGNGLCDWFDYDLVLGLLGGLRLGLVGGLRLGLLGGLRLGLLGGLRLGLWGGLRLGLWDRFDNHYLSRLMDGQVPNHCLELGKFG
jgi:hypothetical protein